MTFRGTSYEVAAMATRTYDVPSAAAVDPAQPRSPHVGEAAGVHRAETSVARTGRRPGAAARDRHLGCLVRGREGAGRPLRPALDPGVALRRRHRRSVAGPPTSGARPASVVAHPRGGHR